jgi:hypothetical protein
MSILTDEQYAEYLQLLKEWIEADKALKGPTPEAEARERARAAHAALQGFRERYGLERERRALERTAPEAG